MESQQKSTFNASLVPGLILGITLIVVDLIYFLLGLEFDSKIKWLSFLVMAAIMFWGMTTVRDKNFGGYVSFGKAFAIGFWMTVIAAIIGAVYAYFYFSAIDPGAIEELLLKSEEEILAGNKDISDEQLDQALSITEMFVSPGMMVVWSFFGNLFFGAIISLIISIFVKRENTNPA